MFGYVRPGLESLDEAQKKRYRAWYCGLCQSLGDRHGFRGRMTLTYDMTFLAIFLSALYEPAEAHGQMRCLPHPKEAHDFVRTSMTDYAADMTIALAYFKALDDWQDEKNYPKHVMSMMLKKDYAPGFFIKHYIKDMNIATEEAEDVGLELPILNEVLRLYERMDAEGLGNLGTQALIKEYEKDEIAASMSELL